MFIDCLPISSHDEVQKWILHHYYDGKFKEQKESVEFFPHEKKSRRFAFVWMQRPKSSYIKPQTPRQTPLLPSQSPRFQPPENQREEEKQSVQNLEEQDLSS